MTVRILIDDERSFADGRETVVARDVTTAVEALRNAEHIDELWLDYVLARGETVYDILAVLEGEKAKLSVDKVFIHSSSSSAYLLLSEQLVALGVPSENIQDVWVSAHF